MDVDITKSPNHAVHRCGMCMKSLPTDAIDIHLALVTYLKTKTKKRAKTMKNESSNRADDRPAADLLHDRLQANKCPAMNTDMEEKDGRKSPPWDMDEKMEEKFRHEHDGRERRKSTLLAVENDILFANNALGKKYLSMDKT